MSLSSKLILSLLAGLFFAMLAWVVVDFNGFYSVSNASESGQFYELFAQQAPVGMIFGLFVGLAIGLVNGLGAASSGLLRRYVGWGALVGLFGGLLGLFFGQIFFGYLYQDPRGAATFIALGPLIFIWDVIIRAIGWALIGFFIGLVQGLPINSKKAARYGAIGGFIGGLIGGALFEIVPYILPPGTRNPSIISRGISMTITGASIGFFIGLIENLMKQAWIRVVAGRNEGREYIITKPRTAIGRDELSDIGLFGDRDIAPTHTVVEMQNNRHTLRDMGSSIGTSVNGQKVAEDTLRDGDIIEIGSMKLEFHEKATASRIPQPVDAVSKPAVQIPAMPGFCPFCGSKKDPVTGMCACSVGAPQPPSTSWPEPTPAAAPVTAAGVGPRLVGTSGPYAGQSFSFSPSGTTSIGREPGRDIELPMDTTVSRKHARIVNEGGSLIVYDDGSSNGTSVNGTPITRQALAPGDLVSFGTSAFRLEQ